MVSLYVRISKDGKQRYRRCSNQMAVSRSMLQASGCPVLTSTLSIEPRPQKSFWRALQHATRLRRGSAPARSLNR